MSPLQTRSRRQRRAPMAEINVTPMVDVMLVLLIIFMVTAPLLLAGVPVNLPSSKAASLDQEQKPVQISLDRGGAIFVDRERVSESALGARLARIAGSGLAGGPLVYLRADRGLDYGKVMAVMGEINAAGLKRLALVSVAGPEAP